MCIFVCPHAVFRVEQKKVQIVDRDACMECGACAGNCPEEALSVRPGVGCAYGIIIGKLRGTEATCDCGDDTKCCC
jgi:ferredoxin-like protein FixX